MALLYGNENFPLPVVTALRQLGYGVTTVQDSKLQAAPDEGVLAFAVSQGWAVLTLNRKHFIRLHRARPDHAGIIVCSFDPDFQGQAARIDALIKQEGNLAGKLLRVHRPASA